MQQYTIYTSVALGVVVLTTILYLSDTHFFKPYFGNINPLLLILTSTLLGGVLLSVLLKRGWFVIYRKENQRGFLYTIGLALLFAATIITVDVKIVLPDNINVPYPASLLFYPPMGFFVEIIFHVLSLTLLLVILTVFSKEKSLTKVIWWCIIVVSTLEPVYQSTFSLSGQYPPWVTVYIALHIFLINLSQLLLFKNYGFISMYSLRLTYYLSWHIIWGEMRLALLF
ncbi:MAG: hypothetical protein AAGE93_20565 [Bacteroidota bacterium]